MATTPLPYIPYDVVVSHILPHLGIDVRVAFRVTPRRLDHGRYVWLEKFLTRRLRATKHSTGSGLTWVKFRIPCTGKMILYHAYGSWRGCDMIDYWSRDIPHSVTTWEYDV